LPRNHATEASKGAIASLDSQKKAKAKRDAAALADAKELAVRIEAMRIAVKAKAGGNGKLFGAVTNADVADAITESLAVPIDKHKVEIKSQIKALGSYPSRSNLPKASSRRRRLT